MKTIKDYKFNNTVQCKNHNLFMAVHDKFRTAYDSNHPFYISGYQDFYLIRNSYLIGSKCVCIDDINQIDDAFNMFDFGVPFCDERFPKTFGEEYKMRNDGVYPFEYQQKELIIDLRVPKIYEELQSVTSIQGVEFQSVTLNDKCPCGCGFSLSGRQKSYSSSCRKRLQRNNDAKK